MRLWRYERHGNTIHCRAKWERERGREKEKDRLSYLFVLWDIHQIKGNNVSVIAVIDILLQSVTWLKTTNNQPNLVNLKEENYGSFFIYFLFCSKCNFDRHNIENPLIRTLQIVRAIQNSNFVSITLWSRVLISLTQKSESNVKIPFFAYLLKCSHNLLYVDKIKHLLIKPWGKN